MCTECFLSSTELFKHRKRAHRPHHDFRLVESAHLKQAQLLRAHFPKKIKTLDQALFHSFDHMLKLTTSLSSTFKSYKINFTIFVEMFRLDEVGRVSEMEVFPFRGLGMTVVRGRDGVVDELARVLGDMERNVDEFLFQGSGWIVNRPLHLDAEVVRCLPLRGGQCGPHTVRYEKMVGIKTSDVVDGEDGRCFYYAVAQHLMGKEKRSERVLRRFIELGGLKELEGKTSFVEVADIDKFEELNKELDIAISVVYQDEEGDLLPVRAAKGKRVYARNHMVLLLFHTATTRYGKQVDTTHYSLVTDPARLFAIRKEDENGIIRNTKKSYICWNCHNVTSRESSYNNHIAYCHQNECQKVSVPRKGEVLSFTSEEKMCAKTFRSAFMLFFDFETLQVPAETPCSCSKEMRERRKEWEEKSREEREEEALELRMLEGEVFDSWIEKKKSAERRGSAAPKPPAYPRRLKPLKMCQHKTKTVNRQPPFTYSYVLINREGEVLEENVYVGEDADEHFVLEVLSLSLKYLPTLTPGKEMEITKDEREILTKTDACYICKDTMEENEKVIDHDHLTGEILGVAHNLCNLHRREQVRLTCFAHNFSGYDSHLIVKAINKYSSKLGSKLSAIPLNMQKFKSFSLDDRLVFLDSCQFLPDSLANLVESQKKAGNSFPLLTRQVKSEEQKALLLRKGVYPYSFATSQQRLQETTSLPPIQDFFNDLKSESCSPEDYAHAQKVWEAFGCRNMQDFTNLYVRTDSLLLAEVVLSFRNTVWDCFGLDMCQYLSLPHLAKDIMLHRTGAEIDLISDQEMNDVLQKGIRGGLSFVNVRHAEMKEGDKMKVYDKNRRTLIYLDANNLYGNSMRYPLPLRNFRWMTAHDIQNFDVHRDVSAEDGPGYILEVDLDYPEELHLPHNSMPLAPQSMDIQWDDLSPYSQECLKVLRGKDGARERQPYHAKKLTSTFRRRLVMLLIFFTKNVASCLIFSLSLSLSLSLRRKYLVHGLNLKLYLEMGLKLVRIRRGITFYQEQFIRPFIEECTERRRAAATITEQTLWKLVANCIYGKVRTSFLCVVCTLVVANLSLSLSLPPLLQFIESYEKRMDCKFNHTAAKAMRHSSSPLYKGTVICGEDLSITFMKKKFVKLSQCWGVGFSILEISKYLMQRLFHREILPRLGVGNVSIVMSDTDSFLLEVKGWDENAIMDRLRDVMDFSNLSPDHPLYDTCRSKVPGYLKNEVPNTRILEVVALKSKTYALRTEEGDMMNKAKGVVNAVKKTIPFHEYRNCLNAIRELEIVQNSIRSVKHVNMLLRSKKVAFSSFDDKRYLFCPKHSAPYGSYLIRDTKEGECPFCEMPDLLY